MTCRLQQTKSCHQRDSRRKVADTGGWDGDGKDSRLFFFSFSMAQDLGGMAQESARRSAREGASRAEARAAR